MLSVIDAKICTYERERDSQEKRLAQLKVIDHCVAKLF